MQGKFGMIVVTECGHVIQEDQPSIVAQHIRERMKALRVPLKFNQ
jgi:pimeloyl-ACP methyl ester carboxylesterase